jgi:transposase
MTEDQRRVAAYFWRLGHNTLEIANHLSLPESVVYNNIEFIKTEARLSLQTVRT